MRHWLAGLRENWKGRGGSRSGMDCGDVKFLLPDREELVRLSASAIAVSTRTQYQCLQDMNDLQ